MANDDYVLLKKNINLEEIFNAAFICSLIALLFGRVFHVIFNPDQVFLNPLGFLLFPYFPGLSLTGGVVGGALTLFAYSKMKKFPTGRVFDFFALSLVFVLPVGLIFYLLLSNDITRGNNLKLILYTVILISSNIYLYPKASALEIKDGSLSILFLIFFSLISLLGSAIDRPGITLFVNNLENFALLAVLIVSLGLLLKQEIIGRISINDGR